MKKQQLFHDTSIQLAGMYLAVLMTLSLIFSGVIFRLSSNEFDRNFNRANEFANRFVGFRLEPDTRATYLADRIEERDMGKSHIVGRLILLNVVILVAGGGLCYILARRTLEPIEEAHSSLERFTSDAAHELRTPLTSMRTEIEVALMQKKLSVAQANTLLQSNLEEVNRLTELSDRLLGLARGDSGVFVKENITINDVVSGAVEAVLPRAKAKKITIEGLADTTKVLTINGDVSSLTEAVIILLDNAIKYSEQGSSVVLKASVAHNNARLSVTDKGVGIAANEVDHIFERFYRSDVSRTKSAIHGYGLGLPLAQKIVAEHEGTITVKSALGKGSTFTLSLPLA